LISFAGKVKWARQFSSHRFADDVFGVIGQSDAVISPSTNLPERIPVSFQTFLRIELIFSRALNERRLKPLKARASVLIRHDRRPNREVENDE